VFPLSFVRTFQPSLPPLEKKNLRPLVHPHTIGFSDDFECHFPLT